jgi:hypothetical protein
MGLTLPAGQSGRRWLCDVPLQRAGPTDGYATAVADVVSGSLKHG